MGVASRRLCQVLFAGLTISRLLSSEERATLTPGDPVAGISSAERDQFRVGFAEFTALRDEIEGLGPGYNGRSCGGCHNTPGVGGSSMTATVRAGRVDADGFTEVGGGTLFPVLSIPRHQCQSQIPDTANVIARRMSTPTFGAGLIEAIPDETLLALEDPDDRDQ